MLAMAILIIASTFLKVPTNLLRLVLGSLLLLKIMGEFASQSIRTLSTLELIAYFASVLLILTLIVAVKLTVLIAKTYKIIIAV